MTAADDARPRNRLVRVWWAAPLALVTATGAAIAVVVVPDAANRAQVPRQLLVTPPASAQAAARAVTAPRPHHTVKPPTARSTPTVVPTTTPAPAASARAPAAQSRPTTSPTRIVTPQHSVVSESPSSDDGSGYGGGDDNHVAGTGASSSPRGDG